VSGKLRGVGRGSANVTTRRGEANHGPAEALGMARGVTGRPDNRPVNLGMVRQAHADTKIFSDFLPRRCSLNK
jgi:hypothetical protein